MKPLLLILVIISAANFSGFAQAKYNFHYKDTLYTISIDTPKQGVTRFKICNQKDTCRTSPNLLWPFQEEIFRLQFGMLLSAIDSTTTKTSATQKLSATDLLVAWYPGQFKPAAPKPNANFLAGIDAVLQKPSNPKQIGVLVLNKNKIKIKNDSVSIKEVRLSIVNGVIAKRALYVVMEDGKIYFNRQAPINFPRFFKRKDDSLVLWQGNDSSTLQLSQVFTYFPFGRIYYPEDKEITLLPEDHKDRDTLTVSSSLNNAIEMAVYTDLLGILGNKANGLIQTEVAGHFVSNTGNIKNTDVTFHHFMKPYLRLSRFDSKFRSLDSSHIRKGPQGDTLDRSYLTQISYLQAGLKINIVKIGLGINQQLFLNAGGEVNLVNADSTYKSDLTFFNYYGELDYRIIRLNNFGMDATLKWSWQLMSSSNKDLIKIANRESQMFFTPMFNIYYFPNNDAASKIYFRFAYVSNNSNRSSNYSQFQVGYRTSLKL